MILSKDEINKRIKEYKKESKENGYDTILSLEEIRNLDESINNIPEKYKKGFEIARNGNYSEFNSLPVYLKNYLGAKRLQQFHQECGNTIILNEKTKKFLEKYAMDGAFRVAISTAKHIDKNMNKFETYMNEYLLVKTLTPPKEEEKINIINRVGNEKKAEEMLNQNLEKQIIMAKTFFMAHLGKYDLKESETNIVEYQGSIAETIVHGGRTNFILPYGGDQAKMMQSYTGEKPKKSAGLEGRIAATHYSNGRKVNDDGTLTIESKEEKPYFFELNKIFSKQYGMDIAAGGIGAMGPNQKAILSDGSAGHMYIRKETGDSKTCGSLLIGFESAATGKVSFTGHKHTMLAKSSKQSAFMADKFGQGIKTDGRTVDLSGLDCETFTQLMQEFDRCYRNMQQKGKANDLFKFNSLLSGQRMSTKKLEEALLEIGFNKELISKSLSKARVGLDGRKPVKEESIIIPNKQDLGKWAKSFADELKKANINLSTGKGLERLKVAQRINGKVILTDLFDIKKHTDVAKCYQRLKSVLDSNFNVYVYNAGETKPNQIRQNGFQVTTHKIEDTTNLINPVKPNIIKSILNKITFGKAYKDEFSKYEFEKEVYNYNKEETVSLNIYEQEREKVAKQEIAEINRISLNQEKIKFDVDLERTNTIQTQRVNDVSKEKNQVQNLHR